MKELLLLVLSLYAGAHDITLEERVQAHLKEAEPLTAELKQNAQRLEDSTLTLEEKVSLCARSFVLQQKISDLFHWALHMPKQEKDHAADSSLTPEEQAAMTQRLDQLESRLQKLESDQAELKVKLR